MKLIQLSSEDKIDSRFLFLVLFEFFLIYLLTFEPFPQLTSAAKSLIFINILGALFSKKFKYILITIICPLLVHGWLSEKLGFYLLNIPGVNVGTIFTTLGLLIFLYYNKYKTKGVVLKNKYFKGLTPALILFIVIDFSVFFRGIDYNNSELIKYIFHYLRIFTIFCYFFNIRKFHPEFSVLNLIILVFFSTLLIGYSIFREFLNTNISYIEDLSSVRISGFFDPNYTMVAVGFGVIAILGSFSLLERKSYFLKVLLLTSFLLGLIFIIISGSRSALFSTILSLFLFSIFRSRLKNFVRTLILGFIIIIIFYSIPNVYQERYLSAKESYNQTRVDVAENALKEFSENIIWGNGRDTYFMKAGSTINLGAHNTYLAYAADGGLVYLFSFLTLTVLVLVKLFKIYKETNETIFLAGFVISILFYISALGLSYYLGGYTESILISYLSIILSKTNS